MPYEVSYEEQDGIDRVVFSGSAGKDEHSAAIDETLRLCRDRACSKILADFSALCTSHLSALDTFFFGETVANAPFALRIAHVLPEHAGGRRNVQFATLVETNRGKLSEVFETAEQAREWLLSIGQTAQHS